MERHAGETTRVFLERNVAFRARNLTLSLNTLTKVAMRIQDLKKTPPITRKTLTIESDRFGSIELDLFRNLLFLRWSRLAETIPRVTYQDQMRIFSDIIVEKQIRGALIDTRQGLPDPNQETIDWQTLEIMPKIHPVLERLGCVASCLPHRNSRFQSPRYAFPTFSKSRYFDDETEATLWVMGVG